MPIRIEFRHLYGRAWREVIRPAILQRARSRCEQCGKANRQMVWVWRSNSNGQYWSPSLIAQQWTYCVQGGAGNFRLPDVQIREGKRTGRLRQIYVVLTIAHLNHTPGDDRPENLKALCQWCHLNYDKLHHKETRALRKDRTRPLLAAMRRSA